ncbi:MAG: IS110 family transposase [Proteobacteria bacterium]|nr:IS110 family transposase [Pseudomonadota bacterium]
MEELYVGLDLHSRNTYTGIMTKDFKRVFGKRLTNYLPVIVGALEPFRNDIQGIVVESTYNWYWLVDGLMDAGYDCLHLANPSAIKQYEGLKHVDDKSDSFWLAHLLSLGILPEGYIYPKEERPVRDLLRKRSFLVKQRTSHIHSLKSMIERNTGERISTRKLTGPDRIDLEQLLKEEYLFLSANASRSNIKFLSHHIKIIEKAVRKKIKIKKGFEFLKTVPGIGDILALTIMLEVGDINRFPKVGDFSSYCRCVSSKWTSNGKSKGKGNTKNGNKYLAWAFVEAAHFAQRFSPTIKRYYQRKSAKRNEIVGRKAIANKLARACYYIMRDRVPFKEEASFC